MAQPGELPTITALLGELRVPFTTCASGLPDRAQLDRTRLVIASAERLCEGGPPHLSSWPRTIAVAQVLSKTLAAHLLRIGASMVLSQPIHPRALRLLMLHEIYHGPERRQRERTLIGQRIQVRDGLFPRRAMLLELSPTGARIQMSKPPAKGRSLGLSFGRALTGGKTVKLKARVVRSAEKPGPRPNGPNPRGAGDQEIGVWLVDARRHRQEIRDVLNRFARGPATWREAPSKPPSGVFRTPSARRASAKPVERVPAPVEPPADPPNVPEAGVTEPGVEDPSRVDPSVPEPAAPSDAATPTDRRRDARVPYEQRIVALGDEAARVLVGRDLSSGGMRIESNPSVAVGDSFRIALHCDVQTEPLVLTARASRDDGPDGLVLTFDPPSESQLDVLERIIAGEGPIQATDDLGAADDECGDPLIVGELLDWLDDTTEVLLET